MAGKRIAPPAPPLSLWLKVLALLAMIGVAAIGAKLIGLDPLRMMS